MTQLNSMYNLSAPNNRLVLSVLKFFLRSDCDLRMGPLAYLLARAHIGEAQTKMGVKVAVWAPNGRNVEVLQTIKDVCGREYKNLACTVGDGWFVLNEASQKE